MRNKLVSSLAVAVFSFAVSGLAFAADMAVKAPPPLPEPVYSWTGFYVGLNAGWSWGKQDTTVNFPGPAPGITEVLPGISSPNVIAPNLFFPTPLTFQDATHPIGAIGGVQVGYNWQAASNWVLGVEADIQASGENASGPAHQNTSALLTTGFTGTGTAGSFTVNSSQSISQNDALLWFGTVRGRVGYAIWPTLMVYGTGGLAYGRLNESVSASFGLSTTVNSGNPPTSITANFPNGTNLLLPFTASQAFEAAVTKTGWTVGGGIEGVVPNTHVTWKAEYLYMDLGTENFSFSNPLLGTILVSTRFTDNIVRVGLNYQFH
jgi:outer membrane immunogenic protein